MKAHIMKLLEFCPDECIDAYFYQFYQCFCGEVDDSLRIALLAAANDYEEIENYDAIKVMEYYEWLQNTI